MRLLDRVQATAHRRHKHLCFACDQPILKGDTIVRATYVDDTIWRTEEHTQCDHEVDRLVRAQQYYWDDSRLYDGDGLPPGHLEAHLEAEGAENVSEEWRSWYEARRALVTASTAP